MSIPYNGEQDPGIGDTSGDLENGTFDEGIPGIDLRLESLLIDALADPRVLDRLDEDRYALESEDNAHTDSDQQ